MALNGILAGLVGITAGADLMSMWSSIAIGLIAGLIVVPAVMLFDKLRIDDPVGAISVHLVCGIWGTLAVGIFSPEHSFGIQLLGVVTYGAATSVCCFAIFGVLGATLGLRVSEAEEVEGLDLSEHGGHGYDLDVRGTGGLLDQLTSPAARAAAAPIATTNVAVNES